MGFEPAEPSSASPALKLRPLTPRERQTLRTIYNASDDVRRHLDQDRSTLRLLLRITALDSGELKRISHAIENEATRLGFPAGSVRATGTLLLIGRSFDEIVSGVLLSLLIGFAFIFPGLVLFTRSARLAALAMIPNVVPLALVFGLMGWLGYKLDFANCTIAAIMLGIAVDDTIIFLSTFRRERDQGQPVERALEKALQERGPTMLISTLVLTLSFSILNFAPFLPTIHFGQLLTFAFTSALLAELTLHPALLASLSSRESRGGKVPPDGAEQGA
jgi:hypothetical protein